MSKKNKRTETVETVEIMATVTNCKNLNVRSDPSINALVLCTIPEGAEIMVTSKPVNGFYPICTEAGVEGYCMQDYIRVEIQPQEVNNSGEYTDIN